MTVMISRRAYVIRCGSLTAAVVAGGIGATGCAKQSAVSTSCSDAAALSDADRQTRASFAYIDVSTIADRICANCSVYVEPSTGGPCGGCQLIKGQISAAAYCNAWAPKGV
jgi:hypothetical protein